jgi:Transcription elongation factor, GreA/GreB, C-term
MFGPRPFESVKRPIKQLAEDPPDCLRFGFDISLLQTDPLAFAPLGGPMFSLAISRTIAGVARDVRYFAERVASAVPQPEPGETVIVAFGSQVTVLRDDDRRQTFRIVGEDEADPGGGSIAYVSPLARLLIGQRVGEAVELDGREIEVVAIE